MRHFLLAAAAAALACASVAEADHHVMTTEPGAVIATAVAAPDRPDSARKLDASRKPAETLAFLGLKPGMDAADLLTGTGYWAEIMGHVVGSEGSVTAYQPAQFYTDEKSVAAWSALTARSPAVKEARYPFDMFAPPAASLDFALVNLSYHDLYWESEKYKIPRTDSQAYVAALYAGMRPGGVVGVIDHVGMGEDTRDLVERLHRIDPATVRADFERAGFVLEAEGDFLRNPADDHLKNVFDPAIRGETDRFVMKFRKPAN